jgi:hypothetical protein
LKAATPQVEAKGKTKPAVKPAPSPVKSLAALIDPMLLAGGHTVKNIAGELARKGGDLAKGKDLKANVRARMVSYTRKGWQITKDADKCVQLLPPKA